MTVLIGIRHTRDFTGSVVDSLFNLRRPPEGVILRRMPNLRTDDAANRLVLAAIAEKATHLLFWDSDQRPPAGALVRLLERKLDIVGCLTFGRLWPHWPVSISGEREPAGHEHRFIPDIDETYQFLMKYNRLFPTDKFAGAMLPRDDPDMLVERAMVGLAFTLIRTEVFVEMFPGWNDPLQEDVHQWFSSPDGLSREDSFFCVKAREAGFKIHMDRSVVVGHGYGDQHISPMDFLAFYKYVNDLPSDERDRLKKIGMS